MNKRNRFIAPAGAVLLGLALLGDNAPAAQKCPFAASQPAQVCQHWSELQQKLHDLRAREKAAQQALQSFKNSLPKASGQARARQLLERALAGLRRQLQRLPGHLRLKINPDYKLIPDHAGYTAVLKPAQVVFDDGRYRIDVSPLKITINPLDSNDARVALQLPDTIPLLRNKQRMASVDIGAQAITGLWSDDLDAMKKSHLELQDLRFNDSQLKTRAALAKLGNDQTLAVDGDGKWHIHQQFKLGELQLTAQGYTSRIGALLGNSTINGIHYRDIGNAKSRQDAPPAGSDISADKAAGKVATLMRSVSNLRADVSLHDITQSRAGSRILALKTLKLGSHLKLADQAGSVGMQFGFSGLQSSQMPLPRNLTPRRGHLQIDLANVDAVFLHDLLDLGIDSQQLPPPERKDFAKKHLPELLNQSGLTLKITDTYLAASAARAALGLHAVVAPEQPLGAVGNLLLTLTGMDKIKQRMSDSAKPSFQEAAKLLAMALAFSNRSLDDGNAVDKFDLEFTRAGKVLLNHKDITALLVPEQQ